MAGSVSLLVNCHISDWVSFLTFVAEATCFNLVSKSCSNVCRIDRGPSGSEIVLIVTVQFPESLTSLIVSDKVVRIPRAALISSNKDLQSFEADRTSRKYAVTEAVSWRIEIILAVALSGSPIIKVLF